MPTTQTPTTGHGVVPYRLNKRQFETMIQAGVFPDQKRVELLGGILVEKMTKYDPQNFATSQLGDLLRQMLRPGWLVSEEKSVVLGRFWRPEPDIMVLRGPRESYRTREPRTADIALLVEVADSSYPRDRGLKWRGYAAARVPGYWIVHLSGRQVEVYGDPTGRGRSAAYQATRTYGEAERVPVTIEGGEIGQIAVKDLLT